MNRTVLSLTLSAIMLLSALSGLIISDPGGATKPSTEGRGAVTEPLIPAMNGVEVILEECETINLTEGGQTQFLGFYDAGPRVADNGDVIFIADLGQCDSTGGETHEGFGYFHYVLEDAELHQIAVHDQTIQGHTLNLNYVAGTIGLNELIGNGKGDLVFSTRTTKGEDSSSVVMAYYSSSRTIELLAEKYGATPYGDRVWCGFENLAINDRGNVALLGDELTDENCYTSGEEYGSIYIYNKASETWLNPEISDEMNVAVDGGAEFGQNCGKRTCDISLGYNDQIAYIDDSQAYGEGGQCSLVVSSMGESSATIHTADYCYDMELSQVNQYGDVLFLLLEGDDNLPDDQRRVIYRYSEGVKKAVGGAGSSIESGSVDPVTFATGGWQYDWGEITEVSSTDVWMDEEGNIAFLADATPASGTEGTVEPTTMLFHDIPSRLETEEGLGSTMKVLYSDQQPIFAGVLDLERGQQDEGMLKLTPQGDVVVTASMSYPSSGDNSPSPDDLLFLSRDGPLGKISLVKDSYPTPLGGAWSQVTPLDVSNTRQVTFWGEISSPTDEDSEARGDSEEHTVFAVTGDRDLDGILDVWEGEGIMLERRGVPDTLYDLANSVGDYPDLVSTGSQVNHKDIFVEIDYMKNHKPSDDALQDVIRAFASAPVSNPDGLPGINLHIFVDEQISNSSWKDNHQYSIKSSDVLGIAFTNGDYTPGQYRTNFFGTSKERADDWALTKSLFFKYAVFAHVQDNKPGTGGTAHISGSNLLVTMGGARSCKNTGFHCEGTRTEQRNTFMHELGHTLGLTHGGGLECPTDTRYDTDEDCKKKTLNYKPNYLSVMNYAYKNPAEERFSNREMIASSSTDPAMSNGRLVLQNYMNNNHWPYYSAPDYSRETYHLLYDEYYLNEKMFTILDEEQGAPLLDWVAHSLNTTDPSFAGKSRIQRLDWVPSGESTDGRQMWIADVDWNGNHQSDIEIQMNLNCHGVKLINLPTPLPTMEIPSKRCKAKTELAVGKLQGWNDWENLDLMISNGIGGDSARSYLESDVEEDCCFGFEVEGVEAPVEIISSGDISDFRYGEPGQYEFSFQSDCSDQTGCPVHFLFPDQMQVSVSDVVVDGSTVSHTDLLISPYHLVNFSVSQGSHQVVISLLDDPGPGVELIAIIEAISEVNGTEPFEIELAGHANGGVGPYVFSWDFDDGTIGTGESVHHQYTTAGDYTVIMVVTDALGTTAQDTLQITVSPVEPDEKEVKEKEKAEESSIPYPRVLGPLCILALVSHFYRKRRD